MKLSKVLFVGGNAKRLASVQIRCVDIAKSLGCDFILNATSFKQIPQKYSIFVIVKPSLDVLELEFLQKRGLVIWDIIDTMPPKDGVDMYLASTKLVAQSFSGIGKVKVVPHHHCNRSGVPNGSKNRHPVWIGGRHWCPMLNGFDYSQHFVERMSQKMVIQALRSAGIGLNFRHKEKWAGAKHPGRLYHDFHVSLNSGIKLINCIGFGIPSISNDEPAYKEIGPECTIFANQANCVEWVKELQRNDRLYNQMRSACLLKAKLYHVNTIAEIYKRFLESL